MPNPTGERTLLVGKTGSGKTAQIWTLPGKKFAYIFDPNSMKTLRDCPDLTVQEYYPDFLELDATLKGFNKGAKSDRSASKKEPTTYLRWVEDINDKVEKGQLEGYQWLCFDSLTFLVKAVMDRQLYINNRYGDIEDLGDYRIVGSKIFDVFMSINSLPMNIYATGHIDTYQDDKTSKIETQIRLPGKARSMFPLIFTNIWRSYVDADKEGNLTFKIRTQPEPRGLQDIRSGISGLPAYIDVTIPNFPNKDATKSGIGALMSQ